MKLARPELRLIPILYRVQPWATRASCFGYDALAVLTAKGLLRRIQPAGSPARYEDRVGDNHHHLICRACERMVDVDCAAGEAPCLTAVEDLGYEIDEAEVIYWGRCPECVAAAPAAGDQR